MSDGGWRRRYAVHELSRVTGYLGGGYLSWVALVPFVDSFVEPATGYGSGAKCAGGKNCFTFSVFLTLPFGDISQKHHAFANEVADFAAKVAVTAIVIGVLWLCGRVSGRSAGWRESFDHDLGELFENHVKVFRLNGGLRGGRRRCMVGGNGMFDAGLE